MAFSKAYKLPMIFFDFENSVLWAWIFYHSMASEAGGKVLISNSDLLRCFCVLAFPLSQRASMEEDATAAVSESVLIPNFFRS